MNRSTPRRLHLAVAGAAQIIVNDSDLGKPQLPSPLHQAILQTLALLVVKHLVRRRLADVNDGAPSQAITR